MRRTRRVGVGAIENAGPNTLISFLRIAGAGCARIDLAVAFVTAAGLDSLLFVLRRAAARGRVRVLTGLYQGFTDPRALRTLLREQEATGGRLEARLSRDARFHWKSYLLVKKNTATVVVGSSNLTDDGLYRGGELNLVLSVGTGSKQFAQLQGVYDRHWQAKAEPLTGEAVDKYERWRIEAGPVPRHRSVPVSKILSGTRTRKPGGDAGPREPRYWRTCIDGDLADKTVDLIERTTDWEGRGYLYFSTWNPTYRPGDRVILFDLNDRVLCAVEVKETTRTPVRTPDGFHFAAYRPLRGLARRRLVPSRWDALKAAGLLRRKADAHPTRKLSEGRFRMYLEQLKKS
jgi:HKD family nuclease